MDIKKRIMETKLFWRLWLWWGMRKAAKERKKRIKEGRGTLL